MPNRPRDDPWERQKGESAQAYEAFVIYRDMGPDRSQRAVSQKCSKSISLIRRWSSANNWQERVRAFENSRDEADRREALKKLKETNDYNIRLAAQLKRKAVSAMILLSDDKMSAKDIALFIDKAVSIEREALKEEAGISAGGQPIAAQRDETEATSLADEIVAAYEMRKRGEAP